MGFKHFLLICAILACVYFEISAQIDNGIPTTRFTCHGRPAGYYADVETGCQVYHMCDGHGRQFSYTCPNTTLFQQRMLICDHWYMVNCAKSERNYDANLLIGQRDKPFVTDAEMQQLRTPRPDVLSVPLKSNYYEGLREAESKYPAHPGNGIGSTGDDNNDLDTPNSNVRPSHSWSTGTHGSHNYKLDDNDIEDENDKDDSLTGAASYKPIPTFKPRGENQYLTQNFQRSISTPSNKLIPPFSPTTPEPHFDIDLRMKDFKEDSVVDFINRFDPDSPDSIKTSMTKTEIIDLNKHLPAGQSSAEDERVTRNNKNFGSNFNIVEKDRKKGIEPSRFDTVNSKPNNPTERTVFNSRGERVPVPNRELVPPKVEYSSHPSTTVGPPVYYEWKWAVPAFDLDPPKVSNDTNNSTLVEQDRKVYQRSPFSSVTRPPTTTTDIIPRNVEYDVKSYLIPDYVFPLDKPHPGYSDENAMSSFQVKLNTDNGVSYGENPNCPQCHPAYVIPGTCEPCIAR